MAYDTPAAAPVPGSDKLLRVVIDRAADFAILTPEDRVAGRAEEERRVITAEGRAIDERWQMRKSLGQLDAIHPEDRDAKPWLRPAGGSL